MENKEANIPNRVLFVDDEEKYCTRSSGSSCLKTTSYLPRCRPDGLAVLKKVEVPVVVSDQRIPVMNGAEFFKKSIELSPDTVRIILTGYSDVEAAIGAVKRGGAYRYVSKHWNDNELLLVIRVASMNIAFSKRIIIVQNSQYSRMTN